MQKDLSRISSKGFTLVELLVAVGIIVMILGAAVTLEVQHIRSADLNKHKLQAENLAQGALNLTRTIRDDNLLEDLAENPMADINADPGSPQEYCIIQAGNEWTLKAWSSCTANEKQKTLDSVGYTVKITVEDPGDEDY